MRSGKHAGRRGAGVGRCGAGRRPDAYTCSEQMRLGVGMPSEMGAGPRRARWRLPAIGVSALVGTFVTLALPAVLGRALDAVVSGRDAAGWVATAGLLVAAGVVVDLVDAIVGT